MFVVVTGVETGMILVNPRLPPSLAKITLGEWPLRKPMARARVSMRKTICWLALPALLFLAGCGGVRSYDTRAIYDATANGYQLEIVTKGSLPWGQDHNPVQVGQVTITPLGAGANPTVTLDFAGGPTVAYTVGAAAPVTASWDDETAQATLLDILAKAGYKVGSVAEVEESVAVIRGALLGPKLTYMGGQTKALKVGRVTFH